MGKPIGITAVITALGAIATLFTVLVERDTAGVERNTALLLVGQRGTVETSSDPSTTSTGLGSSDQTAVDYLVVLQACRGQATRRVSDCMISKLAGKSLATAQTSFELILALDLENRRPEATVQRRRFLNEWGQFNGRGLGYSFGLGLSEGIPSVGTLPTGGGHYELKRGCRRLHRDRQIEFNHCVLGVVATVESNMATLGDSIVAYLNLGKSGSAKRVIRTFLSQHPQAKRGRQYREALGILP